MPVPSSFKHIAAPPPPTNPTFHEQREVTHFSLSPIPPLIVNIYD